MAALFISGRDPPTSQIQTSRRWATQTTQHLRFSLLPRSGTLLLFCSFFLSFMALVESYGYFEIRARPGNGTISSSFWFYKTQPDDWTEIDVFEMSGRQATHFATHDASHTHIFRVNGTSAAALQEKCNCSVTSVERGQLRDAASCTRASLFYNSVPFSDDFHNFTLLWTPSDLVFSVNNTVIWSIANHCMHQPLTLNFDRETMPDWFGLPPLNTLPDRPFAVDYVRVWRQP